MPNQDCLEQGSAGVARAEHTALELFQLASLLVGDPQEALQLVEESVSASDLDLCAAEPGAEERVRRKLTERALQWMRQRAPQSFEVEGTSVSLGGCVETDDLEAAGISSAKLAEMLSGGQRQKLRSWLDDLPMAQRAVFVLRAVLGRNSQTAAEEFRQVCGADGWTADYVSAMFRSALCSLANQLAHSTSAATA